MVDAAQQAQKPDPIQEQARALWLAPYDLPEYRKPRMTAAAHADLKRALKAQRVPNWALSLLRADEIESLTGGET